MKTPTLRALPRWLNLALAALVAACGGGGGGGSGGTPVAAPVVTVTIGAPGDQAIFEMGNPVSVNARVTVDGAVPADGTAVRFAASSGSFAPASPATQAGVATATFSAAVPGRQEITASVQIGGQTANAVRVVYLRPAPAPLELLVPAYFSPTTTVHWNTLVAGAAAHPGVAVTAIMNPDNGIFTTASADYTRVLTQLSAAGGRTVGYVYTGYGTGSRSMASIKANIDNYLALYGRALIGGFFLDEMASAANRLDFYREIYSYIKAKDAGLRVIGNPGTFPDPAYAAVADVLVTFENSAAAFTDYDPRSGQGWLYQYANSRQSALVHSTPTCTAMQIAVRAAATARFNAGPLYVTDLQYNPVTGAGNPWATLPSYWPQMLDTVAAINRGGAVPAC
ncbi:spherulation-specific family 4 protein [Xylophilus ampelinus]|uniref:Spherulation-specific family 4 protein n=1 Tax=Xylophilus ampelinus TaxID=54067 RepID=A0A318SIT2_9BURK|nr:spherulation-specific family 4 protein [Xylophilus ampelinus]MCS4510131.1 hypothetical protein [Xylophilus ampelinus]PYE78281.1 spherulation-specific family 4 protein [Xylophilus ampelinus]